MNSRGFHGTFSRMQKGVLGQNRLYRATWRVWELMFGLGVRVFLWWTHWNRDNKSVPGRFKSDSKVFMGLLWDPDHHLFLWENVLILNNHLYTFRIKLLWSGRLTCLKKYSEQCLYRISISLVSFLSYIHNIYHNCGEPYKDLIFSFEQEQNIMYCHCFLFAFGHLVIASCRGFSLPFNWPQGV